MGPPNHHHLYRELKTAVRALQRDFNQLGPSHVLLGRAEFYVVKLSSGAKRVCLRQARTSSTRNRSQENLLLDSAKGDVFNVHILLNAVLASLTAQTGFLDASKRRLGGRRHSVVGTQNPVFQLLG